MRILDFGSLNIDYTYSVPHIVVEGETLSSESLTRSAGGKGANQSAALAKAGLEVYHAGRIGKDGLFLLDLLNGYGVNTDFVDTDATATGNAIIQLDEEGRNSIIIYGGGNKEISKQTIDCVLSHFDEGDLIILQNEINNIDYIIAKSAEKGMKICFNPAPYEDSVCTFPLNLVNIIVVNEIEGAGLAGLPVGSSYEEILDTLLYSFPNSEIILTIGKHGALYGYGDIREKGKIVDLPVLDTTAAGDTFIGYYLASILKGYNVRESLDFACKASSLTVSRKGAMESIPYSSEVF